MRVADVMKREVVTIRENATISELGKLLATRGISGAPVVDRHGRLVGVVSLTDIVSHLRLPHRVDFYRELWMENVSYGYSENLDTADSGILVRDIMSPFPCTVCETDDVIEAARLMVEHGYHRIPVTDSEGRLRGIVSTMDVLRLMVSTNSLIQR
ncbi:MAG: CBS domain-containing protein [Armatimonadetes bacterium]|nr:CBS domain-containing protein [Armatimonadota bacterium]